MTTKRTARGLLAVISAFGALLASTSSGAAQDGPAPDASRRPAEAVPDGQPNPSQFILSFRSNARALQSDADAEQIADDAAAEVGVEASVSRRMHSRAAVVRLSRALDESETSRFLDAVSASPSISYVEADLLMRPVLVPNDPDWLQQWHYYEATAGIHLPEALDTADGAGVVVAVIDTGRTVHPDLDANLLDGHDFISSATFARDGNGRDADESDQGDWETLNQCGLGFLPRDSSWHGTHVAGTIAAVTDNGLGVAGVAPGAKVLPVRVLG
ncbi:MAG: S8 family serine peptidase, partial [Acidimicrobiales bacterium]